MLRPSDKTIMFAAADEGTHLSKAYSAVNLYRGAICQPSPVQNFSFPDVSYLVTLPDK